MILKLGIFFIVIGIVKMLAALIMRAKEERDKA